MSGFLKIIFIVGFLFIYALAVILLKPFRIHRKRKISTISLKTTYLAYLAVLLVYLFFVIFMIEDSAGDFEKDIDFISLIIYLLTMVSFVIPNAAIMLRRKFKKKRVQYNYIFSVLNIVFMFYFVVLFNYSDWIF